NFENGVRSNFTPNFENGVRSNFTPRRGNPQSEEYEIGPDPIFAKIGPDPIFAGEVKRIYVQPGYREGGWGRKLALALLDEARAIGYRELKLDTLDWMQAARGLYASLGFRECAPYYDNPLPGVVYMACAL